MRIIAALALVILLVAAGACGGDDDEGEATASGIAIEPKAQQRAESINLTLADFADGWRVSHLRATTTLAGRYSMSASASTTRG